MLYYLVVAILHLLPRPISCGCLGAGTGAGSCPSPPFRADPSQIEHREGCPQYAECCTEYGYCHPRSSWISGLFRDCNGESNGEELPAETVLAERICSGEVIEEEPPSPSPLSLYVKSSRTGKSEGKFKSRTSGGAGAGNGVGNGDGVGAGGGSGKGKRGPRGPVGGIGGVGGNGPAGPDGNCAWNGPGACARKGKAGGVGGVGGVGGIGQVGWAGPKPNCAWDGPGGCKGKKKKNRRNDKNKSSNENIDQVTTKTIVEKSENISVPRIKEITERNNSNLEEYLYDYSETSYDTEYGFNYDYIEEDAENKIEKRRIQTENGYTLDDSKQKSNKEKSRFESDLLSVQQWLKQG